MLRFWMLRVLDATVLDALIVSHFVDIEYHVDQFLRSWVEILVAVRERAPRGKC